ncbi:hypothetical protein V5799_028942 [Amblyomma americanum]|uniref:MD-2-related lipid-recognition domain-containing protein n=1 Tax=Amblyomma americanum TaxID=6943 RepID=A0AAQ4DBE4_AMBAM
MTFVLAAVVHATIADIQNPPVTRCPGLDNPVVDVLAINVTGAKLGEEIAIDGAVHVKEVVGQHPVLQLSFAKPDGEKLPCDPRVMPCQLNLCNGTTEQEKELSKDWHNTCPVQPGMYSTHLPFLLPEGQDAKNYFGDGNVVVTFKIVNGSEVLGCVFIPVAIDVD